MRVSAERQGGALSRRCAPEAAPGSTSSASPSANEPPVVVHLPHVPVAPVVFTSPHSGRRYDREFLESTRLDLPTLRRSEDCFVDELFLAASKMGSPLLAARFPRAYCDVNREAWELDPAMFAERLPPWVNTRSSRVLAGLGTIARVAASGEPIYRRKLTFGEARRRVATCWVTFHAELQRLASMTKSAFGTCLVVDCHSMPRLSTGQSPIQFIIGDAHGTSCAPEIADNLELTLKKLGYRVGRNSPYAGGYITTNYGRPRRGIHAIQLEIARGLYMDEANLLPSAQFAVLQAHLSTVITALMNAGSALR